MKENNDSDNYGKPVKLTPETDNTIIVACEQCKNPMDRKSMSEDRKSQIFECVACNTRYSTKDTGMTWEKSEIQPKAVLSVTVTLLDNGKRGLSINSETQDKGNIHLVHVRDLLQWAVNHSNEEIFHGIVLMELQRAANTKIVRPGFRPMNMLKAIVGGKGK